MDWTLQDFLVRHEGALSEDMLRRLSRCRSCGGGNLRVVLCGGSVSPERQTYSFQIVCGDCRRKTDVNFSGPLASEIMMRDKFA